MVMDVRRNQPPSARTPYLPLEETSTAEAETDSGGSSEVRSGLRSRQMEFLAEEPDLQRLTGALVRLQDIVLE